MESQKTSKIFVGWPTFTLSRCFYRWLDRETRRNGPPGRKNAREGAFKLQLRFAKSRVDRDEVIEALEAIIKELRAAKS